MKKILVRVCVYINVDLLFSKVLQEDDIDILIAFTSLLRTVKDVNKLNDKLLEQWKTYSTTNK